MPFIRHGTIRDNILFGQPMWRSRYKEALRQASLLPDLELMPDGDLTEVGEHGVTLSGGQKARINLARCIYSRAKTVYMDDILSAVDAHTAQFVYHECLQGSLLKNRTVVLVTHHVSLCLPGADYVVSLKEGTVDQACVASQAKIDQLVMAERDGTPMSPMSPPLDSPMSPTARKVVKYDPDDYVDPPEDSTVSRHIYKAEHSSTGRVAASHYFLVFASAGGLSFWLIFTVLYALNEASVIGRTVFLKDWSSDTNSSHLNSNLVIYASIILAGITTGAARWFWLYGIGDRGFYNRGSRKIHSMLLDEVCEAPMSWFEATPAGRIMNIFGQDVWRLDANSADDFARQSSRVYGLLRSRADVRGCGLGTFSSILHVGVSALIVCFQAPVRHVS